MFKPRTYNSGVVSIYREKDRYTDFKAKRNVTSLEDMDFVVTLAYEEQSKRQQDQEFANENGFSLSLKIRTRKVKGVTVDNKCKAVIENILYDISYLDSGDGQLYLYLEEVRPLAD